MAALRAGDVSSVELTDEAITRIERDDKAINAICVPDFDRARTAAHAADEARARGEDRPLLGLPVTVKESYDIAGLPTTWGIPAHRDHIPAEDAVQVSRLREAGAVILGKTNVPPALQDVQSFNDIYGTTNNPWDHTRTSGGSSGGSAAALAAGFGALSIGSDIAGSLRTPAHFCGVYAHKPTLGLAPSRGMVPPTAPPYPAEPDLAVVGPMARSARDLTLLLDVMAGPDPLTLGVAYGLTLPPARHDRLGDFRVLVLDDHPLIPTGSAVRAGVDRVAGALADAGARVERHSALLPDPTEAALLYPSSCSRASPRASPSSSTRSGGPVPPRWGRTTRGSTRRGCAAWCSATATGSRRTATANGTGRAGGGSSRRSTRWCVPSRRHPRSRTTTTPTASSAASTSTASSTRTSTNSSGQASRPCPACPPRRYRRAAHPRGCRWGCRSSGRCGRTGRRCGWRSCWRSGLGVWGGGVGGGLRAGGYGGGFEEGVGRGGGSEGGLVRSGAWRRVGGAGRWRGGAVEGGALGRAGALGSHGGAEAGR